jgi:alpha-tubulin suppressor-like RCC1 family protein
MNPINKAELLTKLEQSLAVSYETQSGDVGSVLSSVLASKTLSQNNIIVVNTVEDLPDLEFYDSPSGMIYYVENISVFAVSVNDNVNNQSKWITLDGRTLRIDTGNLVWSWGCNSPGGLGNNSTISRSSPVSVVGGFTDWCQVSAGGTHSLGVRTNGTLWSWGCGAVGQLGQNSTISRSSPVSVVGGFTHWCQVSAGEFHSLGLRTNGTLWSWGCGSFGRLGDNSTIARSSPVSVVGGFTDWCQVSAGSSHSVALRTNGTAWSWGCGSFGRLGDNSTIDRSSPVSLVGGFTDWCQVSASGGHNLGVRTNGIAWAWGFNGQGSLGNNSTIDRSSPVSVVGGFTDWCQVSADNGNIAVRTNGTAWSWGFNLAGQLGDNSTISRSSPVSVVGGFTDWCQVSAGGTHSLGVRTNGTLWSWGCGAVGQLGDNSTIRRSSPVSVVGGFTDWCQISAGNQTSLAIRRTRI